MNRLGEDIHITIVGDIKNPNRDKDAAWEAINPEIRDEISLTISSQRFYILRHWVFTPTIVIRNIAK